MSDILGLKLVTGEDIVGTVTIDEKGVQVKSPAIILVQPGPNGRPSMGMADFMMFAEKKEMLISPYNVLFMYEPMLDIKNSYNSAFGSGIVVANSPNVIPFTK